MDLLEGKMTGTPSPDGVSTKLQRIAKLAGEAPDMAFTTLAHHIDIGFLRAAYRRTPNKAPGVDGVTKRAYGENLEENLRSLLDRFKSGRYHAPPVRRRHIPKGGGKTRPIGIPTLEDKVLQRAVAMTLDAVYEQDFLDCSYGFRPGRSAHEALQRVWKEIMDIGGGWVLEVDIKSYFDNIDHGHLRSFLDHRVRDGVLRRLIDKWLKAGVLEDGNIYYPHAGSPQGGVISPLLSNVYLHEVLDKWFQTEVRPRLKGWSALVRYADDFVIIFKRKEDALSCMDVLPKRFGRYGLATHPDKTRLVEFRPPSGGSGKGTGTFDLLGFTHFWGKSRKGRWIVKKQTAKDRYRRALKRTSDWCMRNRHMKVPLQHRVLKYKMQGHYNYYGVTGNMPALKRFWHEVERIWSKWLNRRSSKRHLPWDRFKLLLARYPLPRPVVVHSIYR